MLTETSNEVPVIFDHDREYGGWAFLGLLVVHGEGIVIVMSMQNWTTIRYSSLFEMCDILCLSDAEIRNDAICCLGKFTSMTCKQWISASVRKRSMQ